MKHVSPKDNLHGTNLVAIPPVLLGCFLLAFPYLVFAQNSSSQISRSTGTKTSQTSGQTATKNGIVDYKLSLQRIAIIKDCINKYEPEDLKEEDTIQKINTEIGEKMPFVPTDNLIKDDMETLRKQARKDVEKKYGSSGTIVSKIEAEAAKKYPLYKIGDQISLDYYAGSKHYSVKGKLIRITNKSVTVDDKMVNLMELSEDDLAKIDKTKNQEIRSRYIRDRTSIENQNRSNLEQIIIMQLKNDIAQHNEKNGYIYNSKKNQWYTAQEISNLYIKDVIKKISERQREQGESLLSNENKQRAEDNEIADEVHSYEENNTEKNEILETNISLRDAISSVMQDAPCWNAKIDYNSAYNVWYTVRDRGGSFDNLISSCQKDANKFSIQFASAYALWKEKNEKRTFEDFHREFFLLRSKGLSIDDIYQKLLGMDRFAVVDKGVSSRYYFDAVCNNYGYILGLDYMVSSAQSKYLEGKNKDETKKTFDKLNSNPELLVIDEESLQKMADISAEIKRNIILFRTRTGNDWLLICYFARYIEDAQNNSHYTSYQNDKMMCLEDLLERISKIQTKEIKKQFVNNLLNEWVTKYPFVFNTTQERQVAKKVIPLLKQHPEFLLISFDELYKNKSVSPEERKQINLIRNSTQKMYMSIFWLIFLRAEFENE